MSVESAPEGEADESTDADGKEVSRPVCEHCGNDFYDDAGLRHHICTQHPEVCDHSCPSCDRVFLTKRAMRCHHSQSHGESLRGVVFECHVCGVTDTKEPHHYNEEGPNYCSHDCMSKHLRKEKTIECENCRAKKTFSPPSEAGRFCSESCAHEYMRGEQHPSYKGRHNYYGDRWEQQRRKARERDGCVCQICGKSKEELGKLPSVHHVVPVRKFDDPNDAHYMENLITLCQKHHMKWEGIPLRPT